MSPASHTGHHPNRQPSSLREGAPGGWIVRLRHLYEGDTPQAHRFRYGLLIFDVATILFIVATSFLPRHPLVEVLDMLFGLAILADIAARLLISRHRWRDLLHPLTLIDLVVAISFLAPITGEGAGFLRILRTLRLLHSYRLLTRLRADSPFFCRNEEVIVAVANLAVFLFVMTGIVYETQHWTNPHISNYADALYFTVTALTTTGFGDITLLLKNSDVKKNRYTVQVMADDKLTEKKDRNINEPVQFYTARGGRIPYELVINKVDKNEIVGYLSTPKEQATR